MDKETNVTSHGQQGGITAHTVNIGGEHATTRADDKPPPSKRRKVLKILVALIGVGASIVAILEYFDIGWREALFMADKNINVTSYNQSGGITAGTVNIGSPRRQIDRALSEQILRDMPRDRPITVTALIGDAESFQFATQIHAFMKQNGFPMAEDGISQSVFSSPPVGLQVDISKKDGVTFIVGSAR